MLMCVVTVVGDLARMIYDHWLPKRTKQKFLQRYGSHDENEQIIGWKIPQYKRHRALVEQSNESWTTVMIA